jgi:superfamily II DNA/RNA helicase
LNFTMPIRSEFLDRYLGQLAYTPYPVQEEALLAWFTAEQGVLVCAPTGMGKTLIAEAALFEALHTGQVAYYTTPLIALTEQKFREMQVCAERWGFKAEDIGLVTGNRRVHPNARVLVVVAEILLNRLLNPEAFDFSNVAAVVMDEFHSFADPERGIVWELSLGLLPKPVRLLLLSATVGNAGEFLNWLDRQHGRKLELVESKERRVPLTYQWIPDELLNDHLVEMAKGDAATRKTPALVFCFNRDECWSVAEQLKGLPLLGDDQRARLHAEVNRLDWSGGAGPKMKQILHRGIGVHHAGLLPRYRRVVEDLFQRKLLAAVICTETLASGINLPARSVVLSSLVKGPFGKQKLVDASTAQQIFGRAGRPQYDDRGYVYALAHEDDVKILRWREKYDAIPENTGDPGLLKAKKALKKKKPSRRENATYWGEGDFRRLQGAAPGKLYSKGPLPWRLLAYLLKLSPEVARVRTAIRRRLMDEPRLRASEKALDHMLLSLAAGGFVTLEPPPPQAIADLRLQIADLAGTGQPRMPNPQSAISNPQSAISDLQSEIPYVPVLARPTPELDRLLAFRSVHPVYGAYLISLLGIADRDERIQAMESVLEMPRPLLRYLRVPWDLPPGPLAQTRLDPELIRRGLIVAPVEEAADEEDGEADRDEHPPGLADKLRLLFDALFPDITDVRTQSIWCAGELLRFGGNFNKFVQSRDLIKQEGIVFRHLLRLILLCGELAQVTPPETTAEAWQADLRDLAEQLTASCRAVDPASTDEMIEQAHAADVVEGEQDKTQTGPTD